MSDNLLTPAQARVLACLVEKSRTTPQNYPMTVNAITNAANQKTARHPLMKLTEGEVGHALNQLADSKLVSRDDGSRAVKWRERMSAPYALRPETLAVVAAAILRGAQTRAELRQNAEGLGGPKEAEAMDTVLHSLMNRSEPLLVELPRGAGQKETRVMHCLCGDAEVQRAAAETPAAKPVRSSANAELEARVSTLESQLAELHKQVADLTALIAD